MLAAVAAVISVDFAGDNGLRLHRHCRMSAVASSHFIAHRRTSCAAKAGADNRTVLAAALLPNRGTGSTADSAADDRALPTAALRRSSSADGAAGGTAYDGALVATHLLPDRRSRSRPKSTTQCGAQIIRPAHRDCRAECEGNERVIRSFLHIDSLGRRRG